METVFLNLLNMSITASWLVLAVIALRPLLKNAPKALRCILWALVGIRLICPFSIESILSLIPSAQTVPTDIIYSDTPMIHSGIYALNTVVNPIISESLAPDIGDSVNPIQIITFAASVIWIIGMVAMLTYTVISYIRIHKKVREAAPLKDNIWLCDQIATPFILGISRPRIFLPSSMNETDMQYVIAHEKAHLKRRDHWWKPLGFALLTVYWFNPVLWLAYVLLCRDIELACDEKVIKDMGTEIKKPYSDALINCSIPRKMIAACPLAFGEVGVKSRIKSVLNYKKPAFWIIIVAMITCVAVAVCFLTDPMGDSTAGITSLQSGSDLKGLSVEIVSAELSGADPYIEIKWKNRTFNDIVYGSEFYIYRDINGTWENTRTIDDYFWTAIGYYIHAGGKSEKKYSLNNLAMTEPGKYRFETNCFIEGASSEKYNVWVEFQLADGIGSASVHTFDPAKLVYDDGMFSFVMEAQYAPTYRLVNGMNLQSIGNDGTVNDLGRMDEITLNNEKFNSRFATHGAWEDGYSLQQIKSNNKRAWELYAGDGQERFSSLYLLLQQKDGTYYLAVGYYNCQSNRKPNSDDSMVRWLYRLDKIEDASDSRSESTVGGADGPASVTAESTIIYGYKDSIDVITPTITLSEDGTFEFFFSALSSCIVKGTYELTNTELILTTDALYENVYTFKREGDSFIFDSGKSASLPKYKYEADGKYVSPVPDGAVFEILESYT